MLARYPRFLALVLAPLAVSSPTALGQPKPRPATPEKGSSQEFLKNFETKHKKALAEGNYDVNQWNNDVSLFIYRCMSLPLKADYAIELCEQRLARVKARNAYGDMESRYTVGELTKLYQAAKNYDRAIAVLEEFVQWHKEEYGEKNLLTLGTTMHLIQVMLDAERYDRAIELYQSLIANHKVVTQEKISLLTGLMQVYQKAGKVDREFATGDTILEQFRALKEKGVPSRASFVRLQLARRCAEVGKKELAVKMIEGDLQESRKNNGDDHLETITLLPEVAERYFALGQSSKAIPLLAEAVELRQKKQGADHTDTLLAQNSLAQGHRQAGNLDEAIKVYVVVLPKMKDKIGTADPRTQTALLNLCDAYESTNRLADAEPFWRENVEIQRKATRASDSYQVSLALAQLGLNLLKQEKWADAEKTLGECLAIRRKKESQIWSTFNAASLVGASLMGQKKYKEAEPLLLEGYQGLKQRVNFMPLQARIRLTEALQRLVKLYDETDRKDKADEYRKLLPPTKKP
ncbi:MAG TPA: tetratricopeptide repeat protein [Gemmataceae bacterium]|nr:tetratricopeptide repeat protein [Gemmataceae bacterium]